MQLVNFNSNSKYIRTGCYSRIAYAVFKLLTGIHDTVNGENIMYSICDIWDEKLGSFKWNGEDLTQFAPIRALDNEIILFSNYIYDDGADTVANVKNDLIAAVKKLIKAIRMKADLKDDTPFYIYNERFYSLKSYVNGRIKYQNFMIKPQFSVGYDLPVFSIYEHTSAETIKKQELFTLKDLAAIVTDLRKPSREGQIVDQLVLSAKETCMNSLGSSIVYIQDTLADEMKRIFSDSLSKRAMTPSDLYSFSRMIPISIHMCKGIENGWYDMILEDMKARVYASPTARCYPMTQMKAKDAIDRMENDEKFKEMSEAFDAIRLNRSLQFQPIRTFLKNLHLYYTDR